MKRLKFLSLVFILSIAGSSYGQGFNNPLNVPDTLSGTNFSFDIVHDSTEFLPGVFSPTCGYDQSYLGKTLIFNKGDELSFNINNQLDLETTVHWHGMHVSALNDGGPHNVILPGTSWDPVFTVYDDASTMWYHSHLHFNTQVQVNKGLAGMIIVRDDEESALDLPRTYGVDDFPMIIQDRNFSTQGILVDSTVMGDSILVNGTVKPFLDCPSQIVRLRLLNGSAHRVYRIGISNDMDFDVIASDNGLLEAPVTLNRIHVSPGERYEILLDLGSYEDSTLFVTTYASEFPLGFPGGPFGIPDDNQMSSINGLDVPFLQLNVGPATASPVTSLPTALRTIDFPLLADTVEYRYKLLGGALDNLGVFHWTINNRPYAHHRIDDVIVDGSLEVWELENSSGLVHPFHIHSGHFFVLDRDGVAPPLYEQGKKDVVIVHPGEKVKFLMLFEDFPDPDNFYMYHCHLLNHEDHGMMAQFIVVDSSYFASGIERIDDNAVRIYPVPALNTLNYDLETNEETLKSIVILDGKGAELRRQKDNLSAHGSVDISVLGSGLHFISFETEAGARILKFYKQ